MRWESMRSWPARFTASASWAEAITCRDTASNRWFVYIDAARSIAKASSSDTARARARMPLARSTALRSARRCSASRHRPISA